MNNTVYLKNNVTTTDEAREEMLPKTKKSSPRHYICFIWLFGSIGAVAVICCFVTSYWQVNTTGFHRGLWQNCKTMSCDDTNSSNDFTINIVKILMLIGIVVMVIAHLVCFVVFCITKKYIIPLILLKIVAISSVVAALSLYAVRLEIKQNPQDNYSLGWSFFVGWSGIGLYITGFVFVCLALYRLEK